MAKIYNPSGKELIPREIANWANRVHRQAGGKGKAFSAVDFFTRPIFNESNPRLKGCMCGCGVDENGFSKGEFVLLPLDDTSVVEGGKAYMKCRNCGEYSHL